MRGLSLTYASNGQGHANSGAAFAWGLVCDTLGFQGKGEQSTSSLKCAANTRSRVPFPLARIASTFCNPCFFFYFETTRLQFALSFAYITHLAAFFFSCRAFVGTMVRTIFKQRAVKSCVNHSSHSPSCQSQPLPAVWTMTQSAQLQADLLAHSSRTPQVAAPQQVRSQGLRPARFATMYACVTSTASTLIASGARLRELVQRENQGFQAGPLGNLFSCA